MEKRENAHGLDESPSLLIAHGLVKKRLRRWMCFVSGQRGSGPYNSHRCYVWESDRYQERTHLSFLVPGRKVWLRAGPVRERGNSMLKFGKCWLALALALIMSLSLLTSVTFAQSTGTDHRSSVQTVAVTTVAQGTLQTLQGQARQNVQKHEWWPGHRFGHFRHHFFFPRFRHRFHHRFFDGDCDFGCGCSDLG